MAVIAVVAVEAAVDAALMIYRALNQKKEPLPPLRDLAYMTSTSGAPIPFGYGQARVPGNVLWTTGIGINNFTNNKKGTGVWHPLANLGVNYGPSGTFVYSTNVAVAFGEGPGQILRVWADSKLVYDADPTATTNIPISDYPAWSSTQLYNPGNFVSYIGQVWQALTINTNSAPSNLNTNWLNISPYAAWSAATQYQQGDVVSRSGRIWVAQSPSNNGTIGPHDPANEDRFSVQGPNGNYNAFYWIPLETLYRAPVIYPGDNFQVQDPLIQSFEGAELTPAYRGLIYAVFENWFLFNFADHIPSFRAEVSYQKTANVL